MEGDDTSALIVGDPHGTLGQHLRPHPIHLFNINIIKCLMLIELWNQSKNL